MPKLPAAKRLGYLPPPLPKPARTPTSDQGFYNSPVWRRVRKQQIKAHPFCEVHLIKNELIDCTFGMPIDHLVRITDNGAALALENLATMCSTCHNRKSRLEGKSGCLVKTITVEGEKLPAAGEKERLLNELAKYV